MPKMVGGRPPVGQKELELLAARAQNTCAHACSHTYDVLLLRERMRTLCPTSDAGKGNGFMKTNLSVLQDEDWTAESPEKRRKVHKTRHTAGGSNAGNGCRAASAQRREVRRSKDDEHISHPVLGAIFSAWERAAVDFCAEQEASPASARQVHDQNVGWPPCQHPTPKCWPAPHTSVI